MADRAGFVYLVGAGPGDPGLLTLRAKDCICRADVIIYDRLASLQLLSHCRSDAELIYAGKRPGDHHLTQGEINELVVAKASEGKLVVRLHGGDSFVFGRGGEEAEALRAAGLPYAVVPGVSSATAVPAFAGIPVTHRRCSSSFAVFTGHEMEGKRGAGVDWAKVAGAADTLIFLMGVENMEGIASHLVAHGRSAETPAAAIQWGTTAAQKVVKATIGTLAEAVRANSLSSPAVIIVGEVVGLHGGSEWLHALPLAGKRILLTRALEQAQDMAERVSALGGEPLIFPLIEPKPTEDSSELDHRLARIEEYDWIVFTSANGVNLLLQRLLRHHGRDVRALHRAKLAVLGHSTGAKLGEFGLRPDLVTPTHRLEDLVEALCNQGGGVAGQRFLIPRAAHGRDIVAGALAERGAVADEVKLYTSVMPTGSYFSEVLRQLRDGLERPLDFITFTSSSTVKHFVECLGMQRALELCSQSQVAYIGPVAAQTARGLGLPVDIVAEAHDSEGLVKAIVEYVTSPHAEACVPS